MEAIDRLTILMRTYSARQCLLFAGAGFSAGATSHNLDGSQQNVPTGRRLVKFFKDTLAEDTDDLSALSDLYQDEHGEYGLFQLLKTPAQISISNYPWKEIYTTNYDNVIELSLSAKNKSFGIYNPNKRPSDVDYRTLPIVHINGYIESADFKDFREEIKLTDAQYFSDDFSRSAWGERFRNDIITSPCIVFAGYSLYDLDVARVLNSFEGMKERIFFIVGETVSRSLERKLSQFGSILPIGVDGLMELINGIDLSSPAPPSLYLSAWEKVSPPTSIPRALRDIDVINFLMSGSVDNDQFADDLYKKNYLISINRDSTDYIVDNINRHKL
ncbi:SIR2 family protein [Mesorhizobium sp. M0030]|uniref:SIR2 family protein n=1 Tax=Mesorhizobium sp. M0030 TaxID=2956851 RepID=UPI00333A830E